MKSESDSDPVHAKAVESSDGNAVRLAAGITPADLNMAHSGDGQYLLINWRHELVAMYGPMGPDPEVVEFADGSRIAVDQLLDMVAAI